MKKTDKHTTHKRQTLFKAVAILLPFLFILLLETGLRIGGYGYDFKLFTEYQPNKNYLVFDQNASKRYFTDTRFAPTGNREVFKKKKDAGTCRFFVLGESTTIGYPYFHSGSFHRWLLYRLMHTWPDKNFEIINLSLTAVNSYTVRGFAAELAGYEPDGVLLYVGQNEYYGGLGVGSTQTFGSNPTVVNALLKLRSFRTVQLAMNAYSKLSDSLSKPQENEMTRMELMVGSQQIAYGSDLYRKGIRQFRQNMDATLRALQKDGIPVFFSNIVSNIKDLPPFINDTTTEENAASYYRKAQAACAGEDYETAYTCFTQAKEHDLLRFRAPEELNSIIEELCRQYPNAHFVDTKGEMEDYAPHRLLGNELFTDHVHPNLTGYALMSDAFYTAIRQAAILPPATVEMSREELLANMPVSPIDSIAGTFRILRLMGHWPFNNPAYAGVALPERTIEEKLAARFYRKEEDWWSVHNTLYTAYLKLNQPWQAAGIAEITVLEYAEDPVFYQNAAMICREAGDTARSDFYRKKYLAIAKTFTIKE